jgi:lipoprotein LprG
MPIALRRTAAVVCAAAVLALSGCADSGDSGEDGPDPAERLTNAKSLIDEAASIDFTISTDELPSDVPGLLEAEGTGTSEPAFDGTARVSAAGGVDADVISVDGEVYVKTGFTPVFVELDPAELGAPDPAAFFDPDSGVSSLLVATEELEEGEAVRDGEDVLSTITGTLSGDRLKALLPTADEAGTFDVTYRLTEEEDILRGALITGPFYAGSDDVAYDISLELSTESVKITAP